MPDAVYRLTEEAIGYDFIEKFIANQKDCQWSIISASIADRNNILVYII